MLPMSSVTLPDILGGGLAPDMSCLWTGEASTAAAAWHMVELRHDRLLCLVLVLCWQPRRASWTGEKPRLWCKQLSDTCHSHICRDTLTLLIVLTHRLQGVQHFVGVHFAWQCVDGRPLQQHVVPPTWLSAKCVRSIANDDVMPPSSACRLEVHVPMQDVLVPAPLSQLPQVQVVYTCKFTLLYTAVQLYRQRGGLGCA